MNSTLLASGGFARSAFSKPAMVASQRSDPEGFFAADALTLFSSFFHWMWRYSIWPRSPSRPMGPLSGSFIAFSNTSPLQAQ